MDLAAQLNRLIEDGASQQRLGAWLEANSETVAQALEGMVAVPFVDLRDLPRFVEGRGAQGTIGHDEVIDRWETAEFWERLGCRPQS